MPGAEIQANGVSTQLRGEPLRGAPGWLNVALIVLLAMARPAGSLRIRALRPLFLAAALAVAYAGLVYAAFLNGLIVAFTYPLLALTLATLGVLAATYTVEAIERIRVRDTFARFVPERVVEEILAQPGDALRLGGVERTATVVFTDLRGFTSFSEGRSPDRVIETLNRYLTEMSEAILDHGGTLVSYLGDGILAVFGAPLAQEDHADRALAAACEMVGPRLARFNADLAREDPGVPAFQMGVGINTGPLMWGNVGSLRRLEYTAIGDTVNTAPRLESMTKDSGHQVFIADATFRSLMREPPGPLQDVGELGVRGRLGTVKLWAPVADEATTGPGAPATARPAGAR